MTNKNWWQIKSDDKLKSMTNKKWWQIKRIIN